MSLKETIKKVLDEGIGTGGHAGQFAMPLSLGLKKWKKTNFLTNMDPQYIVLWVKNDIAMIIFIFIFILLKYTILAIKITF